MHARDAVRWLVADSGKTARSVSYEMGRTANFVTNTIQRSSAPRLDTFAHLAEVCGYELVLRGHDKEIVIEWEDGD